MRSTFRRLTGFWSVLAVLAPLAAAQAQAQAQTPDTSAETVAAQTASGAPEATARNRRVLFFGNSLTYQGNLPDRVARLAAVRCTARIDSAMIARGGVTLSEQWAEDQVRERALGESWTDVVLQDATWVTQYADSGFDEIVGLAHRFVERGARVWYYETWARGRGNGLYNDFPQYQGEPAALQQSIAAAYEASAQQSGATVIPVGRAWIAIDQAQIQPTLWDNDGVHASRHGRWAAALTLYASLCDQPEDAAAPTQITPDELDPWVEQVWPVILRTVRG